MSVYLIPLELHDFDIILCMDWLTRYKAQMDCFAKTITLRGLNGRRAIFRGERNAILNCIILAMTAGKMIQKGSEAYVAYVMDVRKEKNELMNLSIVRQFPNVVPGELPGLP